MFDSTTDIAQENSIGKAAKQNISNNSCDESIPPKPSDWTLIKSGNGVALYRKYQTRGGNSYTDYVTVIDLSSGAALRSYYVGNNATPSVPSPTFQRKSLANWGGISNKEFVIANASFFGNNTSSGSNYYSQLAYPLKYNGTIVSAGYGNNESFSKKKLGINGINAFIADYTNTSNTLAAVSGAGILASPTVMVGLNVTAPKSPTSRIGRTFVGIRDYDGNGNNELVYIYQTTGASQSEANSILTGTFSCNETMMFDGSGSSQMKYKNATNWITALPGDYRLLPHVFAVLEY